MFDSFGRTAIANGNSGFTVCSIRLVTARHCWPPEDQNLLSRSPWFLMALIGPGIEAPMAACFNNLASQRNIANTTLKQGKNVLL
jgi:hypothetical protein